MSPLWAKALSALPVGRPAVLPAMYRPGTSPGASGGLRTTCGKSAQHDQAWKRRVNPFSENVTRRSLRPVTEWNAVPRAAPIFKRTVSCSDRTIRHLALARRAPDRGQRVRWRTAGRDDGAPAARLRQACGGTPVSAPIRPLPPSDTVAVLRDVLIPLAARGLIMRRQRTETWLDRRDADRRAVSRLEELRVRHRGAPIRLRLPSRNVAIILSAADARIVLDGSPEPFATANREKRAALARFQPHGVLISDAVARPGRRRFNEHVLDTPDPVHRRADELLAPVEDEAEALLRAARAAGGLTWSIFAVGWWRLVRRLVLGVSAREDHAVTDLLARLRADANWAYVKPSPHRLGNQFLARVREYLDRAEPGSLAGLIAEQGRGEHAEDQVAHWLFAFDAAGMASFRALALIDAHPAEAGAIHAELSVSPDLGPHLWPRLQATVLESLRLWPTTPAILRDSTIATEWQNGILPAGSAILIHVPFFHRSEHWLPEADRFAPSLWLEPRDEAASPLLLPFPAGPAGCAGRNLVLLVTSALLNRLLSAAAFYQTVEPTLRACAPLPATPSPFRLRFELEETG